MTGVHARVHGARSRGARGKVGFGKSEIHWILQTIGTKFVRSLDEFRINFIKIHANLCLRLAHMLVGFRLFLFWALFGHGGCFWGGTFAQ